MTHYRGLCAFVGAVALTATLFVTPAWAVLDVPPPPTQSGGSPGGNPGGGDGPGTTPHDAPEPTTIILAGIGGAAAGLFAWRKRRAG